MKTYYIKQRAISIGNKYFIYNNHNERCLESNSNYLSIIDRLFGSILSIGYKLRIKDSCGDEVITIKKKLGVLSENYNIYSKERKIANIKQHMKTLKAMFSITTNNDKYIIKGDLLAREFNIYKNDVSIAEINKVAFSFKDGYKVDIFEVEEENLILAMAIVIDSSIHN